MKRIINLIWMSTLSITVGTLVSPNTWARGMELAPKSSFSYALPEKPPQRYRVKVAFVDLFDSPMGAISNLKKSGISVICYFSAGSAEDRRPDFKNFPKSALGRMLDDSASERWLDIRNPSVQRVMRGRIELARRKGCNGVDPDNVDGPSNPTGFKLKRDDQIRFLEMLAQEAKSQGLMIGLKNSPEVAAQLEPLFQFAVTEECFRYNECSKYSKFAQKQKPIFMVEYRNFSASLCNKADTLGGSLVFSNYELSRFSFCKRD